MDTTFGIFPHIVFVLFCTQLIKAWPTDPTEEFTELPFNTSFYHIHKPYDLPVKDRYSFIHKVHKFWVYSTDKPLSHNSPTKPHSEMIINGYNYSCGVWQFEGNVYVPNGTSGVCIMQVFGSSPPHASTLMLRVYNGTLFYYKDPALVFEIYDKWFRVNVTYDVDDSKLGVYIDGNFMLEAPGRGGDFHYFKCGVYSQNNDSYYMESRWKRIKILKKNVTGLC